MNIFIRHLMKFAMLKELSVVGMVIGLMFTVTPVAKAMTMDEALSLAVSELMDTGLRERKDLPMVIEFVNYHSRKFDRDARVIQSSFYSILKSEFPDTKILLKDEAIAGISTNSILIKGTYQPKEDKVFISLSAIHQTNGQLVAKSNVDYDKSQQSFENLVVVLPIEAPTLKKDVAQTFSRIFRASLSKTRKFNLVASEAIDSVDADKIQEEYGCTREECSTIVAEQLNASLAITTTYTKVSDQMYFLTSSLKNIKTGRTLTEEALKHDGNIATLENKLEEMACSLAGTCGQAVVPEPLPEPEPPPIVAEPAPKPEPEPEYEPEPEVAQDQPKRHCPDYSLTDPIEDEAPLPTICGYGLYYSYGGTYQIETSTSSSGQFSYNSLGFGVFAGLGPIAFWIDNSSGQYVEKNDDDPDYQYTNDSSDFSVTIAGVFKYGNIGLIFGSNESEVAEVASDASGDYSETKTSRDYSYTGFGGAVQFGESPVYLGLKLIPEVNNDGYGFGSFTHIKLGFEFDRAEFNFNLRSWAASKDLDDGEKTRFTFWLKHMAGSNAAFRYLIQTQSRYASYDSKYPFNSFWASIGMDIYIIRVTMFGDLGITSTSYDNTETGYSYSDAYFSFRIGLEIKFS